MKIFVWESSFCCRFGICALFVSHDIVVDIIATIDTDLIKARTGIVLKVIIGFSF